MNQNDPCIWNPEEMDWNSITDTITWRMREIRDLQPSGCQLIFEVVNRPRPSLKRTEESAKRIHDFIENEWKRIT